VSNVRNDDDDDGRVSSDEEPSAAYTSFYLGFLWTETFKSGYPVSGRESIRAPPEWKSESSPLINLPSYMYIQ
jgi:hypothetical protein